MNAMPTLVRLICLTADYEKNIYTNGHVQLLFVAEPGPAYGVEASTNLTDWELIGVAVDHGEGTFGFTDTNAALFPNRFYRVVSP